MQHDFELANNVGAVFRADANSALEALVTKSSGLTEPTTTYPYQWWLDTTLNLLKMRNSADNAWITVAKVSSNDYSQVVAAGLVSALSLYFSGDDNTGIYSPAADSLGIVAGGTEFLRASLADGINFLGTGAVKAPVGTTGQRPSGTAGQFRYNSDLTKFEGFNGTLWASLGGGGGGAGFQWRQVPSSGTPPVIDQENGEEVALFGDGVIQELYAAIKIPNSYVSGTQIFVYISTYSPTASLTQLFLAQSTLIRKGTDAFDSVTNQRTTTNTALTNTVANQLREHILDVTSSTGQINGVSVSAGDIVKIRLYRDTSGDTDTAAVRMILNATDVKFA